MRRAMPLAVLIGLVVAYSAAAPAAADAATVVPVETPEGSYYLYTHGHNHAPSVEPSGGPCIIFSVFVCLPDASWSATWQVWEETNGCPGLQRAAGHCAALDAPVGADTRHPQL